MSFEAYNQIIPTIKSFVERNTVPELARKEKLTVNHNLIYVTEGYLGFIVDNAPYYLKKGDVLYLPIGCVKKNYLEEGHTTNSYGVFFQYQILDDTDVTLPFPTLSSPGPDAELLELFKSINTQWTEKNDGYVLKTRALFMLLLHRLFVLNSKNSSGAVYSKRMEKVKDYILNNYHKKIYVKKLSELTKLNPVYLGTRFIEYTGIPLKSYINQIRINRAIDLLNTDEYTISEVAYQCGFEDPFYFCKVFKKHTGVSPPVFRRNNSNL